MSIRTIASAYRNREITAQEAFDMLTQAGLLPEAFMRLLLAALDDQDAHEGLIRGEREVGKLSDGGFPRI